MPKVGTLIRNCWKPIEWAQKQAKMINEKYFININSIFSCHEIEMLKEILKLKKK